MSEVTFRLATADDAALVAQLHLTSWGVCYGHLLDNTWLVSPEAMAERTAFWQSQMAFKRIEFAIMDGKEIGFCSAERQANEQGAIFIDNLHVLEAYHGQGLGRTLLARLVDEVQPQGCRELALTVAVENQPARGFYRAMGGVESEGGTQSYAEGSVLPLMRVTWSDLNAFALRLQPKGVLQQSA